MWKKILAATALSAALLAAPAQAQQVRVYRPDAHLLNIFQRLIGNNSRHDIQYELYIQDDESSVNAYSLPDGKVVLLTGLLNALPPGDDNALAFVMAHEISHVELHHVDRLNTQGGLTNLALGWLSRGQGNALQGLAGVGSRVLTSGYSRGMEVEADGHGLELMRQANYNPRGAITTLQLFQRMEANNGSARLFPSHPKADNRLQDVQNYLQERGY